jgi:hypothetical protein
VWTYLDVQKLKIILLYKTYEKLIEIYRKIIRKRKRNK